MAGGHKENTQTQILPSIQKTARNIHACAQIRISKGNKEIKDLWETGLWIPEAWGVGTEQIFLSSQLAPFCAESSQLSQPDAAKQLIFVISPLVSLLPHMLKGLSFN